MLSGHKTVVKEKKTDVHDPSAVARCAVSFCPGQTRYLVTFFSAQVCLSNVTRFLVRKWCHVIQIMWSLNKFLRSSRTHLKGTLYVPRAGTVTTWDLKECAFAQSYSFLLLRNRFFSGIFSPFFFSHLLEWRNEGAEGHNARVGKELANL